MYAKSLVFLATAGEDMRAGDLLAVRVDRETGTMTVERATIKQMLEPNVEKLFNWRGMEQEAGS